MHLSHPKGYLPPESEKNISTFSSKSQDVDDNDKKR